MQHVGHSRNNCYICSANQNYNSMELKQFITEVLTQIAEGTMDAAEAFSKNGGIINPELLANYQGDMPTARVKGFSHDPRNIICSVDFSVTLSEETSKDKHSGIGVQFGNVGLGRKRITGKNESSLTRIEFSIPCVLPEQKRSGSTER